MLSLLLSSTSGLPRLPIFRNDNSTPWQGFSSWSQSPPPLPKKWVINVFCLYLEVPVAHNRPAVLALNVVSVFIEVLSALQITYGHTECDVMSIIVQQDATMYSLLYFCKLFYMFWVVTPPLIRSTYNCNYSIWHWSNFGKCSVWYQSTIAEGTRDGRVDSSHL
jgi:hypothetical protein